jgi:hypothetical protein
MIWLVLSGHAALACGPEVRIQFSEASPDRFRVEFVRGAKLRLDELRIDLGRSAAGAFFDGNDGLEIQGAQPNGHGVSVRSVTYDQPNGVVVVVIFENFLEKRIYDFASDLDDRGLGADPDQNHVYDGELKGATATATLVGDNARRVAIEGSFDEKGHAQLADRACV